MAEFSPGPGTGWIVLDYAERGSQGGDNIAYNLILWSVGVNHLDDEAVATLKSQWAYLLIPSMPEAEADAMWQAFMSAWGGDS